jgi:peroxiredoxin
MPFLLDPDAMTIKEYGVYNEGSERVIPHPTALIIDKDGIVRFVRVDENYRERPSVDEILEALAGL